MESRARIAAASHRFLTAMDKYEVKFSASGARDGVVVVDANPADFDEAVAVLQPSAVHTALSKSAEGLVVGASLTTAFQGVVIGGRVAGDVVSGGLRGVGEAADALFDHVLPATPETTCTLARETRIRAETLLATVVGRRAGGDGGVRGGDGESGSDGEGGGENGGGGDELDDDGGGWLLDQLGSLWSNF